VSEFGAAARRNFAKQSVVIQTRARASLAESADRERHAGTKAGRSVVTRTGTQNGGKIGWQPPRRFVLLG
jgi:hypothetical protein